MHPVLFQTSFFTLNTIWIFITIGFITGIYTLIKLSVKNGLKVQFISDNSLKLILWAVIGARIFTVFTNYNTYFYEFSTDVIFGFFKIWDKGLNLWGALIGFFIYFFLLCKNNKQDFYKWLDVLVPSLIIGLAIANIGSFFEGSNYGRETSLPWGVNFESPSIKYAVPIHPTQIYATIYSASLFTGLIYLSKHKKVLKLKKKGFVGLAGFGSYQLLRFLEEFLRGDDVIMIFGIRLTQIWALLLTIFIGVILYLRYNKKVKKSIK